MQGSRKTAIKGVILGLCLTMIAGCTALYRNHGYVPSDEDLAAITVGVDTRATVEEVIGAPSTSGAMNDGDYYYVRSRVRHFAYQEPEVVERQVLAISFTQAGVVQNIERFSLEDGKIVPLSRRVTETTITNKGFLRQLLGSIGRFSAGDFLG